MDNILLYKKLNALPDNLKAQVLEFIESLLKKSSKPPKKRKPTFGSAKGMFIVQADFDEPLDDFKEYMF